MGSSCFCSVHHKWDDQLVSLNNKNDPTSDKYVKPPPPPPPHPRHLDLLNLCMEYDLKFMNAATIIFAPHSIPPPKLDFFCLRIVRRPPSLHRAPNNFLGQTQRVFTPWFWTQCWFSKSVVFSHPLFFRNAENWRHYGFSVICAFFMSSKI